MNMQEFVDYKYKVIQYLINSQPIIELLANKVGIDIEDFNSDEQIFSYRFVPPDISTENAKTYITLHCRRFRLKILFYSLMEIPEEFKRHGNRIDNLVIEVDKLLNGNNNFGIGKVELCPNSAFAPAENYDGIALTYLITGFNT